MCRLLGAPVSCGTGPLGGWGQHALNQEGQGSSKTLSISEMELGAPKQQGGPGEPKAPESRNILQIILGIPNMI